MNHPADIMLVEQEHPFYTLLAARIQRHFQLSIIPAMSVEDAQSILVAQPPPRMVLMELHLAGAHTGIDLAQWMLIQPHLGGTRRWLFSGTPLEVIQEQVARRGLALQDLWHVVIEKPITVDAMIQRLRDELRLGSGSDLPSALSSPIPS